MVYLCIVREIIKTFFISKMITIYFITLLIDMIVLISKVIQKSLTIADFEKFLGELSSALVSGI